jgi:hypothetical protein
VRDIAAPFVVARPSGARVRTRLRVSEVDDAVLWQIGRLLGALAGRDLAKRCADGRASERGPRKKALTAESSSRWAGAITRTSNDQWGRARANQADAAVGLRRAITTIERRAAVPVGGRDGKTRGYRTVAERRSKLQRRDLLRARLDRIEADRKAGRVSIVRGGRRLAHTRHHLHDAGLIESEWRGRWEAERLFLTADGEADKTLGNSTIRFDPDAGTLDVVVPKPLAHLANRADGRYRLSCPVAFSHRGDEVAAQTAEGAVRYDITFDPAKGRWYLDASWSVELDPTPGLELLRQHKTLAVDLNADHAACWVVDSAGNPVGTPHRFAVPAAGPTSHRDAQVRHLVSRLIHTARRSGCTSITIENLNFTSAVSRDNDSHPRGKRGRRLRRTVAGIPTARFRDRLAQMAANAGLWVVAVDPACTSRWARPKVPQLNLQTPDSTDVTVHDGAAVMVGRRGYGHDLTRTGRVPGAPPADGASADPPGAPPPVRSRSNARRTPPAPGPRRRLAGRQGPGP